MHQAILAIMIVGLSLSELGSAQAAEMFEGIWAKSQEECQDDEGPNSRTLIDMTNRIRGKVSPIFDQYENHCKITQIRKTNNNFSLHLTCFEFWEDFEKNKSPSKTSVSLTAHNWLSVTIDGQKFLRCAK